MKSIILAVLALAISSEASYPYAPAPAVPAVEYGVPAETRTIVPAAPVVTVHETTKPASTVSYNYAVSQVHPSPVTKIEVPTVIPTYNYAKTYSAPVPAPVYGVPHEAVRPFAYSYGHDYGYSAVRPFAYSYGHDYGYSAVRPFAYSYGHDYGYSGHQLVYSNPAPAHHVVSTPLPAAVSNVAVSGIVNSQAVTRVVTQEVPTVVAPEPVVVKNYEYQLPHVEKVVVPEFRKPVVPHTTYGVPY